MNLSGEGVRCDWQPAPSMAAVALLPIRPVIEGVLHW